VFIGNREFGSVKLAKWLGEKNVRLVLRIQKGRYIKEEGENFKRLSDLGLMSGTSFYLKDVQVTKQKGLGKFDIAGYWKRRYRGHGEDEGWYREHLNESRQARNWSFEALLLRGSLAARKE